MSTHRVRSPRITRRRTDTLQNLTLHKIAARGSGKCTGRRREATILTPEGYAAMRVRESLAQLEHSQAIIVAGLRSDDWFEHTKAALHARMIASRWLHWERIAAEGNLAAIELVRTLGFKEANSDDARSDL